MQTFMRRFRHAAPVATTIILYTRAGCHLCELARKPTARFVAATPGATLRVVDVDGDAETRAQYGMRIPVVTATVAGQETVLAEGKVSELWLRRALVGLRGA